MQSLKLFLLTADDVDGENRDLFVVAHDKPEALALMVTYWEGRQIEDLALRACAPNFALLPAVPSRTSPCVLPWEDLYAAARETE